jgi:dolichol-phosphate mannosyltransferase
VPGGDVKGWGAQRKIMSWAINRYARLLLRLPVSDTSGSFRCYRVAKLQELDLARFLARGYAVLQEILYRCGRHGCQFEEVPIVFENRRLGESKINWREVASALWVIARLGVENACGVPVKKEREPNH